MSKPDPKNPEGFYRFTDKDGHIHVVDDLASVPEAFRSSAERLDPKPSATNVFSFVDEDGHTLIANSIEAIPKKYRELAKKVSVDEAKKSIASLEKTVVGVKNEGMVRAKDAQRQVGDVVPFVKDLDIPSVLFGIALALVFGLVTSIFRKTGKTLAKIGMFLLIAIIVAGSYFAWIRRVAGLGDAKLASPKAMIDDAKDAAAKMQHKLDKQRALLEQIERTER